MAPLLLLICLAAPAAAQEEEVPPFDARRKVYQAPDVATPEQLLRLEAQLGDIETKSRWRYYVILRPLLHRTPLDVAREVVGRWEREPDFDPELSFVVVGDSAGGGIGLLPPRGLQDRLGLPLRDLEGLLAIDRPPSEGKDPIEALGELVARADAELGKLDVEREAELERRKLAWTDRNARQQDTRRATSRRLLDLELRARDLGKTGLRLTEEEARLAQARRLLADAVLSLPVAGDEAARHLAGLEDVLARIEARLDQLERDRGEARARLVELNAQHQALSSTAPQELRDQSRQALDRAVQFISEGQPDRALGELTRARELLARARAPEAAVAAAEPQAVGPAWPWIAGGAALLLLGVALLTGGGPGPGEVDALDGLRRATLEQADALEAELRSLRARHLEASRPAPVEIPPRLCFEPGPPGGLELAGETLIQLTRVRSRLEGLHSSWRTLRQAVAHSDVLRANHGWSSRRGVGEALQVLRRLPARSLPLAALRLTEEELARLQGAPAACTRALAEAAQAIDVAERRMDDVLRAEQGTQAFEDALSEMVERAHLAAFWAERDPMGAIRVAGETRALGAILEERVKRTLELSLGLSALQARLGGFSRPDESGRVERTPISTASLLAWAQQLSDDAAQALDEGSREEARRGFERAMALMEDAELLSKGPVEGPEAELSLLRQELHQAHLDLDRLKTEFSPGSWDDVEAVFLRAAGRIEIVAATLSDKKRVPRLRARIQEIRTATLLVSARLTQAQTERDQARGLLPLLEQRLTTLEGAVARDLGGTCASGLLEQLEVVRRELGESRTESGTPLPEWGRLLARLRGLEEALELLRLRVGEELLRFRRARELEGLVAKGIKATEDLLQLHAPGRPGPAQRMRAARAVLERAQGQLQGTGRDLRQAIAGLSAGVEACRGAREILVRRGGLDLTPGGGARSDALRALLHAHHAAGQAHRQWVLGRIEEPREVRDLLRQAGEVLEQDPLRALTLAEEAWLRSQEACVVGRAAEGRAEDALYATEFESRLRLRLASQARERAAQRDELRRRTRFEILVLDQDDAQVEREDIDGEDDFEELASLEAQTEPPAANDTETEAAPPETEAAPPEAEVAPPEAEVAPPEAEAAPSEAEAAPSEAEAAPSEAEAEAPPETEAAPPQTEAAPPESDAAPEPGNGLGEPVAAAEREPAPEEPPTATSPRGA